MTNLDHKVKRFNSEEIDPFFRDKTQNLIFLNSTSEVIYYLTIPVAHASLAAINSEINRTIELNNIKSNQ